MRVDVVRGDITQQNVDAIATAINSGGLWFGGIDMVIQRCAGTLFHLQASGAMPLTDGQTIVARGNGGQIKNVVFVVDDLQTPLSQVILAALLAADEAGFNSVALPTIRMGVMLGAVEKSVDEALTEMVLGTELFAQYNPKNIKSITFVVYNDSETQSQLLAKLAHT